MLLRKFVGGFSVERSRLVSLMSLRARSVEPRPDSPRKAVPTVFVLCGPSGCGKSTLIAKLMADYPGRFGFSVSHTTRQPREGEINGVHYLFTDQEKMKEEISQGMFLEHAMVHGNIYGTSISAIHSVVGAGKICILDIDVQGVENVKASERIDQSSVVYAMLIPPSVEELERRLRGRKTESEDQVSRRIKRAKEEIEYASKEGFWHAVLVNDTIESCYEKLVELVENQFRLTLSIGTLSAKKPPAHSSYDR